MLARAAAKESNVALAYRRSTSFYTCSASSLTSKWVGEGEKILRALFRVAKETAPSIIFFDEIDAVLSARKSDEHEASRRFKTEFMVQVDGLIGSQLATEVDRVLILGCTNTPWDLDDAVLRRFQRRIYAPLPDTRAREGLLKKLMKNNTNSLSAAQVKQLIAVTDGYSSSDLVSLCKEAAFGPLRSLKTVEIKHLKSRDIRAINFNDFAEAMKNCRKSVSSQVLKEYKNWEKQLTT